MTWQELVAMEPRLQALEDEARRYARLDRLKRQLLRYDDQLPPAVRRWAEHSCANALWYGPGELKHRMSLLVGYHARDPRDPRLRTEEAYDVAYDHLYGLLPDCRNCWCL